MAKGGKNILSNRIITKVQWGETDAAGIVYYPNYFRWFDLGTHELFRAMGLPLSELMKDGTITPLLSASVDFKAPLYYDDDIEIVSTFAEIRRSSFCVKHTVQRGEQVTGAGLEWRGWVVSQGGRLTAVPVPDDVRSRMDGSTSGSKRDP